MGASGQVHGTTDTFRGKKKKPPIGSRQGLGTGLVAFENRKYLVLLGIEPRLLGRPPRSLVIMVNRLSRLTFL